MRVLVTGASGMLGTDILEAAARFDVETIGADIRHSQVVLDITRPHDVSKALQELRPDVVIHCAAYTDVEGAETHEGEAFRLNAMGAWSVATACEAIGAAICYISTDFVFDGRKASPYHEYDAPAPLSVYGASKLAGEQAVARHCRRHWIVRTAWLYGLHGRSLPATALRRAFAEEPLRIVADQIGSPTSTADLAPALWEVVLSAPFGTYHRVNSGEASWADLAAEALRLAGLSPYLVTPIPSHDWPSKVARPRYSVLGSLASDAARLQEMRPWQAALRDFVAAHLARDPAGG